MPISSEEASLNLLKTTPWLASGELPLLWRVLSGGICPWMQGDDKGPWWDGPDQCEIDDSLLPNGGRGELVVARWGSMASSREKRSRTLYDVWSSEQCDHGGWICWDFLMVSPSDRMIWPSWCWDWIEIRRKFLISSMSGIRPWKKWFNCWLKRAKKNGRKIGICGQAPSDYPEFAEFLVRCGSTASPSILIQSSRQPMGFYRLRKSWGFPEGKILQTEHLLLTNPEFESPSVRAHNKFQFVTPAPYSTG